MVFLFETKEKKLGQKTTECSIHWAAGCLEFMLLYVQNISKVFCVFNLNHFPELL